MATSEETREERLRRLAKRDGNVFRKLRKPMRSGNAQGIYMLTDGRGNFLITLWETLEEAEGVMLEK
jgi:hypothetical protein